MHRKGEGTMAAGLEEVVGCLHRLAVTQTGNPLSDRALLERFARGRDEAAFAELVRRHGPMVLRVARRVLQDRQDAEDVFQAVFLVLARKAATVPWRESVGGWLFPVARHLAVKQRARRERRRQIEAQAQPIACDPEPADPELRSILDEELGRLPEHYRAVVVLCYVEGHSQGQAARQLGLSAGEVRGRLDRARQRLRQRLTRRGLALSTGAVLAGLSARAAVPPTLIYHTARIATVFAASSAAGAMVPSASRPALDLAQGALHTMKATKLKHVALLFAVLALLAASLVSSAVPLPSFDTAGPARAANATAQGPAAVPQPPAPQPGAAKHPSVILLWMSGGPSQLETFDLKPGHPNGGAFREINTVVPGIRISEHLPKLAKLTRHLTIIRSVTSSEGDHTRGSFIMHTGHAPGGLVDFPSLGSIVAKEFGNAQADLPPYVSIGHAGPSQATGPGYLGEAFAPLEVSVQAGEWRIPPARAFERINKKRAAALHQATEKAFDLSEEKAATRDTYGRHQFGQGCLVARRLVERGVPCVEVTLGGWDHHGNIFAGVKTLSERLDPAWATLLTDLEQRKLLDKTLIVWMGEFGRTPQINVNNGRDHYPRAFTVVLAGAGIKGGQVIGQTGADGTQVVQRPVTPPELMATILRAVRIDPRRQYQANNGQQVPLVPPGTQAVQEALK
jgi:RNA polymerase sigma factor (sigma-70 family)